jgi:hypothetical protein
MMMQVYWQENKREVRSQKSELSIDFLLNFDYGILTTVEVSQ